MMQWLFGMKPRFFAMKQRYHRIPALLACAVVLALAGCSAPSQDRETSLSALHYFNKGNAAFMAEDYGRAINHYRRALTFDENTADIHYNLGLAYYRAISYDQAIQALQKAVALDPGFPEAHHNLALAYDKIYDMEGANLHFNRYRALVAGNGVEAGGDIGGDIGGGKNPGFQAIGMTPDKAPNGGFAMKNRVPRKAKAYIPPAAGRNGMEAKRPVTTSAKRRGAGSSVVISAANRSNGPNGNASSSNPFQGNRKWWTQDTANLNR